MGKKIILDTKKGVCYVCDRTTNTELHHIFYGRKYRRIADEEGMVVYLCPACHRGTDGVHGKNGHALDYTLKEMAQEEWERLFIERYPYKRHAKDAAREAWLRLFGKNYIQEE